MKPAEETLDAINRKLQNAIDAFFHEKDKYRLDIEDLGLKIKLAGPLWSGVVDRSVAKFLLDLDKMLAEEFAFHGILVPETEHGLVSLQINDGSLEACLKYSQGVITALSNMSPRAQILVAVTIVTAMGIFKGPDIIAAAQAVRLKEAETELTVAKGRETTALVEAVGKVASDQTRLQAPLRNFIGKMDDRDRIELPGKAEPLSRLQAQESLAPLRRSRAEVYRVDHPYEIKELQTPTPENWKIGLSFGNVYFKASLNIPAEQMASLLDTIQTAHEQNTDIALNIHVDAKISSKGVVSAMVVGLGAPRKDSIKLSEALELAKEANEPQRAED